MAPSCSGCLTKKERFCQKIVTKGNNTVKCRRKPMHKISIDTLSKETSFFSMFSKPDAIYLCEFHYIQYINEKKEFEKKFGVPVKKTDIHFDLSSSHDG